MVGMVGGWLRSVALDGRELFRRVPPIAILLLGAAYVLVYSFPGYMNFDSAEQLSQARQNVYDDWHPPLMARYWRFTDRIWSGPLPLLVLQTGLFLWGLYGLLKRRFQPRTAAVMTVAILWFPPIIAPFAPVWKDSQMVGFLLAGTMLMFGESRAARIVGGVLLFFAAGVRDNACTALPPLLLVAVASWGFTRKIVVCLVAFAVWCVIAMSARQANVKLAHGQAAAWVKANVIHDIAGTICFEEPMTDAEILRELDGIPLRETGPNLQKRFCEQYDPRWWFPLSYNEKGLFNTQPDEADRNARKAAYFRLIKGHPKAFLRHRWAVSKELLGLAPLVPDEPNCQTFSGAPYQAEQLELADRWSWAQVKIGAKYTKYTTTLLFRPWAYVVIGFVIMLYALWKRDGLVLALVASGFLYELSFMVAAAGAPFRYSNWMILCVSTATLIVFAERLRAGLQVRRKAKALGAA
jgi:hypothetical protein